MSALPTVRVLRPSAVLLMFMSVGCEFQHASHRVTFEGDASEPEPHQPAPGSNASDDREPEIDLGEEKSDHLFDPDALRTYELRLRADDLAYLDQDPMAEQYVPGELVFEGKRIAPVGIRYKGSTGAFVGCLSDNYFPPSGSKICPKLSMKVKIDYSDPDAKFYGQKKLLFHAMNSDRSLLRERLGYSLYRALGVEASRTAHVRLLINGRFAGLFLLVEEVDGRFTRSRFADGGRGNLYKEVWPVHDEPAPYLAALETNRDGAPQPDKMVAFARELLEADDEGAGAVLERWMDTDYVARFVAVDRTIHHDDGPYHWYCQAQDSAGDGWHRQHLYNDLWCGNHNYYWYEDAKIDRLWPVPWDLDGAMPNRAGFTNIFSRWDDLSYDCSEVLPSAFGGAQMPITCDPLQRAWTISLRAQIHAAIEALIRGPLAEPGLSEQLDGWARQIEDVVAEAADNDQRELTPTTWHGELELLKTTLARLRTEAELTLMPPAPVEGTDDAGGPDGMEPATQDAGEPDSAIEGMDDAGEPGGALPPAVEEAGAADSVVPSEGTQDAGEPDSTVPIKGMDDAGEPDGTPPAAADAGDAGVQQHNP